MASEIISVIAVHAGHTSGLIGIMLQLLCRLQCLQDRVYEHVQLFSHCIHGWVWTAVDLEHGEAHVLAVCCIGLTS
jgi:hypothetical protein